MIHTLKSLLVVSVSAVGGALTAAWPNSWVGCALVVLGTGIAEAVVPE